MKVHDAELYVLAGGRSRRFGSDKALAEIDGRPLLQHVVETLGPAFRSVTLVCDRADRYSVFGCRGIADDWPDCGPMGGLHAAMLDLEFERGAGWLFLASCDLLRPEAAWIDPLAEQLDARFEAVAFRASGGRWEPTFAFYHAAIAPRVAQHLDAGRLAMQALLDNAATCAVALPAGMDAIPQANTPDDLKRADRS
jgi:molybdopterin-guanine dinucleotide biosynthesis protein A